LSREETRKERKIEEDKYIYYETEVATSEASEPHKREKLGLMTGK
jgi:hypothetical protein